MIKRFRLNQSINLSIGVNCTKEDIEALTNSNNDVAILDFNDQELFYERTYQ